MNIKKLWLPDRMRNLQGTLLLIKSLTFTDGHYVVGMPCKKDRPSVPDNYSMALSRLQCTDKKLKLSPELGKADKEVLQTYQEKGYIDKVPHEEVKPDQLWYLPHFPSLEWYCIRCVNEIQ